jgi:hypothetical protein
MLPEKSLAVILSPDSLGTKNLAGVAGGTFLALEGRFFVAL